MLVLLQQHGVHQSLDRSVVGKDADHTGAPLDLFVDALEQVGALDLLPVLRREVAEGQHVLAGLEHELCCPGKAFGQGAGQVIPAGFDLSCLLLSEYRAQGSGDHLLMSFWHRLEQVPGEMDPAALPAAALQHSADRVGEAPVGIADDELDPCESALFQRADELAPEALAFAVSDLETEQLPAAISVHAHGDDDGSGADLHRLAQPAVEVGGIEVQVGVTAGLQGPAEEGLHLDVDVGADAAHLGFGDPALGAESGHQGINLPSGDASHVGLHHHRIKGLIHAAARLEGRKLPERSFGILRSMSPTWVVSTRGR